MAYLTENISVQSTSGHVPRVTCHQYHSWRYPVVCADSQMSVRTWFRISEIAESYNSRKGLALNRWWKLRVYIRAFRRNVILFEWARQFLVSISMVGMDWIHRPWPWQVNLDTILVLSFLYDQSRIPQSCYFLTTNAGHNLKSRMVTKFEIKI